MRTRYILAGAFLFTVTMSGFAQTQNTQSQLAVEQRICAANGHYVIFAQRPLKGHEADWKGVPPQRTFRDEHNLQYLHEHIFFCANGRAERNIGFGDGGRFSESAFSQYYEPVGPKYNSVVIAAILDSKEFQQSDGDYHLLTNNCQDFDDRVRKEYWLSVWEGEWEGSIDGRYTSDTTRNYKLRISIKRTAYSSYTGEARFEEIGSSKYAITDLEGSVDNPDYHELVLKQALRKSNAKWCINELLGKISDGETPDDVGNVLKGFTSDWCRSMGDFKLQRKLRKGS